MAPGVAKSFIKELYKVMCIKYPECSGEHSEHLTSRNLSNEDIKEVLKKYRDHHRLILDKMDYIKDLIKNDYCKTLNDKEIQDLIDLALKYTEDDCHQAMEAVIHNLNSMHSRAGRSYLGMNVPETWETLCPAV
jgi:ribonucleoside-triphosphate reductase